MTDKTILFYPSGHGFGHAVRQIEIIKEIFKYNLQNGRSHKVIVRTTAPEWIFNKSLELYFNKLYPDGFKKISGWFSYFYVQNDVGTIQKDSLNMDIDSTYKAALDFYMNLNERAACEAEFIKSQNVDLIVGDIPPLAFAAAEKAGVSSVGVSNFSWDYIYEEFIGDNSGFLKIIDIIRAAYSKCGRLLKLPFACPLPAFKETLPVAMIARKPYMASDEVYDLLSLDRLEFEGRKTVMISFGGFDTDGIIYENLEAYESEFMFLTTAPIKTGKKNPRCVKYIDTASCGVSFENLFSVFDIIATKPGYGVVGDILGAGAMCLYTDRGRFREYEYLVNFLEKHSISSLYITRDEILNCDFKAKINELLARRKKPAAINLNGAYECAMAIIDG